MTVRRCDALVMLYIDWSLPTAHTAREQHSADAESCEDPCALSVRGLRRCYWQPIAAARGCILTHMDGMRTQSTGGPGAIKGVQVKGREGAWQGMTNKCAPGHQYVLLTKEVVDALLHPASKMRLRGRMINACDFHFLSPSRE